MKNLQNWWTLTAIQIGCVICLPTIMIGQTLSQNYGFLAALAAILLGNAILLILGLITVRMCHANRKTTMENAAEYFGELGSQFFAMAMIVSLVSWFAIQLSMMSLGVLDLFSIKESRELWLLFFNIGLGLVMTFATLFGIKGIGVLANLSLPFLFLTLGYAAYTVDPNAVKFENASFSFNGTSLVIALAIAFVVDLPTYYRFGRTCKDGLISMALIFVLIIPAIELVGVYLTAGHADGNILQVLKRENQTIWNTWVALFLILAGWTTNNLNQYSAGICLQSIFKQLTEKKALLYVGLAGTFLSCFDLLKNLELVLDIIGIFIAGMGSVILTRYLFIEYGRQITSRDSYYSLLAWILGIVSGFIGMFGYTFTAIPLLDAVLGACIGTVFFTLRREGIYEKA